MKRAVVWTLAATLLFTGASAFVVDPGVTSPDPVDFDDTVQMGVSDEDLRVALHEDYEVPRAQVFYSQFGFVVGFTSTRSFVRAIQGERYERVWGRPVQTYVSDFSGTDPSPVERGFVEAERQPDWIPAEDAYYVSTDDSTVGFSSREDAEDYASTYGGETASFEELLERPLPQLEVYDSARDRLNRMSLDADRGVGSATKMLDREVAATVAGGNRSTSAIERAIDSVPRGTTVKIESGVYHGNLTVDRPVTLLAVGAVRIRGTGDGTVVSVESDDVALSGLDVDGVGDSLRGERTEGAEGWDRSIEEAYGGSDAGVAVDSSDRVLVDDVEIDSPATGVLLFDSEGVVVRDSVVRGSDSWGDGFMDVLAMRSPAVVQNTSLYGGRDSVYSHASDGLVVRDSYMDGGRFGLHLMYTSDVLVRNNTVRDSEVAGLVVMTRPTGVYVVGNDVRRSGSALITVGRRSLFAENTLVDNEYGLKMGARNSVYARNVVAENHVGARASTVIPSNEVTLNDFVDNDVQVVAAEGAMRIWGYDSPGNYWSDAPEDADSYRPTDPIDSSVTSVDGAVTFRRSPAYSAMKTLETTVSGTWRSGVVDEDPQPEPVVYEEGELDG